MSLFDIKIYNYLHNQKINNTFVKQMRETDEKYTEKLLKIGYERNQIETIIEARNSSNYLTFEQFDFLYRQGAIERTAKLRKPRNIFEKDGEFFYLNHYKKEFEMCGKFKSEEE